jgi:hypothetical protein
MSTNIPQLRLASLDGDQGRRAAVSLARVPSLSLGPMRSSCASKVRRSIRPTWGF